MSSGNTGTQRNSKEHLDTKCFRMFQSLALWTHSDSNCHNQKLFIRKEPTCPRTPKGRVSVHTLPADSLWDPPTAQSPWRSRCHSPGSHHHHHHLQLHHLHHHHQSVLKFHCFEQSSSKSTTRHRFKDRQWKASHQDYNGKRIPDSGSSLFVTIYQLIGNQIHHHSTATF